MLYVWNYVYRIFIAASIVCTWTRVDDIINNRNRKNDDLSVHLVEILRKLRKYQINIIFNKWFLVKVSKSVDFMFSNQICIKPFKSNRSEEESWDSENSFDSFFTSYLPYQ